MEWLWTWGGKSFGYSDGDNLWTHDGRHVGRFYNDEVYGPNGKYLGERRDQRLIAQTSKKSYRRGSFSPYAKRVGHVDKVNYGGYVMIAGYEDFPDPDDL